MKRVYRLMILALIGFTLGGTVAYLQARSVENDAPMVQEETVVEAAPVSDVSVEIPATAAAETALNAGAADVADATAETSHDHAAMTAEMESHDAATHETVAADATTGDPAGTSVAGSKVGGAFSLTDHNGQAVTHESWPGKYKLVFFGFTHCPDICPAALDRMTAALTALGADAANLQPLLITIDPARDDAATMKAYLANYHASILGLTGTDEQIKQAENAYKVYAAKVDGADAENYNMAHSSYIFLMSPTDELLEIFRDSDPADAMAARIKTRLVP